jgi:hypothetical protein
VNKRSHTNAPTADFIRSMRDVSVTLNSTATSLLSAAVRLAEAGQDEESMPLIDLAKGLHRAEVKVRKHSQDAGIGKIVKMSEH